jgi:Short C-terminal domain
MILIRRPNSDEVNMNLAQEVERLAKLHAEGAITTEEFTKAKSQLLSAPAFSKLFVKGIRRESPRKFFGLPLWAIAIGADWERGEIRGHARGIFAFGDIATGWFAFGGLARGFVAFGGLAIGLFAFGGFAIGILVAVGGGAIGGLAVGGAAVGGIAIGGGACGYYALGGGVIGVHTVSGTHQDPAALDFFQQYFPWLTKGIMHTR